MAKPKKHDDSKNLHDAVRSLEDLNKKMFNEIELEGKLHIRKKYEPRITALLKIIQIMLPPQHEKFEWVVDIGKHKKDKKGKKKFVGFRLKKGKMEWVG